jgi:hypothetical protein
LNFEGLLVKFFRFVAKRVMIESDIAEAEAFLRE